MTYFHFGKVGPLFSRFRVAHTSQISQGVQVPPHRKRHQFRVRDATPDTFVAEAGLKKTAVKPWKVKSRL